MAKKEGFSALGCGELGGQIEYGRDTKSDFLRDLSKKFVENGYNPIKGYEDFDTGPTYDNRTLRNQADANYNLEDVDAWQETEQADDVNETEPGKKGWLKRKLGAIGMKLSGVKDRIFPRRDTRHFSEFSSDEKERSNQRLKIGAVGMAALMAAAAYAMKDNPDILANYQDMFSQANEAHINTLQTQEALDINPTATDIFVGGMSDGESEFIQHALHFNPADADKVIAVKHPGSAAPFNGTTTFNESIRQGSDATYDAIMGELNAGREVDIKSYSQGTVILQDALQRIADENGGTLPEGISGAMYVSSPNTPNSGLYEASGLKALEPLVEPFDITLERYPLQDGTETAAYTTDIVANSGGRPLTTQASQLIGYAFGDGHAAPTAADIADKSRTTTTVVDVVTVHSVDHIGTQTAALRVAEQKGLYVSEAADEFGQAIAPQGEVGQEAPQIDANEVLRTGAALADEATGMQGHATDFSGAVENVDVGYINDALNTALGGSTESVDSSAPVSEVATQTETTYAPESTYVSESTYTPAPESTYTAPAQEDVAPAQEYVAPVQEYIAPAQEDVAPAQEYVAPVQEYVAPIQEYVAPVEEYAASIQEYIPDASTYEAPAEVQQAVDQFNTAVSDFNIPQW